MLLVPHPTSSEILVSLEMLLLLYGPKKILDVVIDKEARQLRKHLKAISKERRWLIMYHAQESHKGKFHTCHDCLDITPKVR